MIKVLVCPICKLLFVYRKHGKCRRCGQSIARNHEFWGKDDIWVSHEKYITYEEGLKNAKNKAILPS